ncbi:hypothetical protein PTI98_009436 [Pleurotus ostreatus]|nr:hypothetical protein PTI98_009436 [Pleurotus ostreatus]
MSPTAEERGCQLNCDDDEGYTADIGTPPNHGNLALDPSSPDGPISTPEAAKLLMDFLFPEPLEFPLLLPDAPRFPTRTAAHALAAQYKGKPLNIWEAVHIANQQMDDEVVEGSVSGESVLVEGSQLQRASLIPLLLRAQESLVQHMNSSAVTVFIMLPR